MILAGSLNLAPQPNQERGANRDTQLVHQKSDESKSLVPVRPKYYTPHNALSAGGYEYRYLKQLAIDMGVLIHKRSKGRRWFIDADDFDRKMNELTKEEVGSSNLAPISEEDALAERYGLRRKPGQGDDE